MKRFRRPAITRLSRVAARRVTSSLLRTFGCLIAFVHAWWLQLARVESENPAGAERWRLLVGLSVDDEDSVAQHY